MKRAVLSLLPLSLSSCDSKAGAPRKRSRSVRPKSPIFAVSRKLFRLPRQRRSGAGGSGDRHTSVSRHRRRCGDNGTIESGRSGTSMPAFAQKAGGMLTAAQIEILVRGIELGEAVAEEILRHMHRHGPATLRAVKIFAVSYALLSRTARGAMAITEPSYLSLVTDRATQCKL